jgi:hypothetical protein
MGVKELRDAFNEVSRPTANCVKALMEYKHSSGVQHQILYFSGSYANGEGFVIQSELIRPSGDLVLASRATAEALLNRTRAA